MYESEMCMYEQRILFSSDGVEIFSASSTSYGIANMQALLSDSALLQRFIMSQESQGLPTLVTLSSSDGSLVRNLKTC
jgi:hypothetical protein